MATAQGKRQRKRFRRSFEEANNHYADGGQQLLPLVTAAAVTVPTANLIVVQQSTVDVQLIQAAFAGRWC